MRVDRCESRPLGWNPVVIRFLAVLLLLAVAAPAASETAASEAAVSEAGASEAGADAGGVEFVLPDVAGRVHRLSEHRGKWVVVNFWATWCGPCMVEIPELMRFHARHKDHDAIVIGVNFEEIEPPALEAFIAEMGIDYLVVRAGDTPILPFEPLKGLPSTFFVDPHGELVASHVGPVTGEAIEDFLAREALREAEGAASSGAGPEDAPPDPKAPAAQ